LVAHSERKRDASFTRSAWAWRDLDLEQMEATLFEGAGVALKLRRKVALEPERKPPDCLFEIVPLVHGSPTNPVYLPCTSDWRFIAFQRFWLIVKSVTYML
jgi:hypothetical protein